VSIRLKRVYDAPAKSDGRRVLVDRIWPRGLTKREARIDEWLKQLARASEKRTVTLVFSAKDTKHNNAVALKEYIERFC